MTLSLPGGLGGAPGGVLLVVDMGEVDHPRHLDVVGQDHLGLVGDHPLETGDHIGIPVILNRSTPLLPPPQHLPPCIAMTDTPAMDQGYQG